jgi:hypothetical protein
VLRLVVYVSLSGAGRKGLLRGMLFLGLILCGVFVCFAPERDVSLHRRFLTLNWPTWPTG